MYEKGFNSVQLKRIALILMILDHIVIFVPTFPIFFRWIGRISAPLFLFCCAYSFKYTSNRLKYLFRLYIFGVVTSFIQCRFDIPNNFIRTLFTFVLLLTVLELSKKNKLIFLYYILWQLFAILSSQFFFQSSSAETETFYLYVYPAITGSLYYFEGGLVLIILGLIFYYTKGNKKKLAVSFIVFDVIYFFLTQFPNIIIDVAYKIQDITGIHHAINSNYETIVDVLLNIIESIIGIPVIFGGGSPIFENIQWMMIASLPFMLLYNGQRKITSKAEKYFFYWFYPLHLLVFCTISFLMTT